MSTSDQALGNVAHNLERAVRNITRGDAPMPGEDDVQRAVVAVVRLYSEYVQRTGKQLPPAGEEIASTDAVVLATALLKACDLNLFDLAVWFNRAS